MRILADKDERIGTLFVLPGLFFLVVAIGYPIVYNVILSLHEVNTMTVAQPSRPFVGFLNYRDLFGREVMRAALANTFSYTLRVIALQFIIGFALALFFRRAFALAGSLRGLFVIAWLIPQTITALLCKFMLSTQGGIINEILVALGIIAEPFPWLSESRTAMWGLIAANVWIGAPFCMILLSAGLSTIDPGIYEGARIDGANALQRFWHITLPLMRPAMMAVLVLVFIFTFKVFDLVFVATGGGPVYATEMLSTYAYKSSFDEYNFSRGAAVANVLLVSLLLVGLLYLRLIRSEERFE